MERLTPTREEAKEAIRDIARFVGRALTLRAFLPEQTFASHGDHQITEDPERLGYFTTPVPDVAGLDIGQRAIRGFDSEGSYREEIV